MWIWILSGALFLAALYWFVDREIYFYEATHLGPRVQGWLYDRWAKKYDADKHDSQLRDADLLARPALEALRGIPAPLILDLATGTGRLTSRPADRVRVRRRSHHRGGRLAGNVRPGRAKTDRLRRPRHAQASDRFPAPLPRQFVRHGCLHGGAGGDARNGHAPARAVPRPASRRILFVIARH